jgi:hypothetical protein
MLGENERVRVDGLDSFSEFPPEIMIVILRVTEVGSHVKPPSVNVVRRRSPLFSYAQDIVEQLTALLVIQLWQSGMSPPSVVKLVVRPGMLIVELEERVIGAVLIDIRAFLVARLIFIDQFASELIPQFIVMIIFFHAEKEEY